jgi:hypothetical protein
VYRVHPFNPIVYGGDLIYAIDKDFLTFYSELFDSVPDEANIEPFFVPDENGNMMAIVGVTWGGDHAAGESGMYDLYPVSLSSRNGYLSLTEEVIAVLSHFEILENIGQADGVVGRAALELMGG